MNLLHNDIIIRNYKDGETIWLSQRLVMQVCGVEKEYLETTARRNFKRSIQKGYKYGDFLPNTGSAWRWGKANGTFYYDYECLPDRKPTHYRSKFGTKHELLQAYEALQSSNKSNKQNQLKAIIESQVNTFIDNTDTRYFMYESLIGFNQTQAQQMATAKAWCVWMSQQLENDNFKSLGINKKQDFYQVCTDIVAPMKLEGFKINSAAYLRNKLNDFVATLEPKEQLDFFISNRYGNDNALVVGKNHYTSQITGQIYDYDMHQALIFHLYMNPGSSTKEYNHTLWQRDYIPMIREFGLEPVSYRTFCLHNEKFDKAILLEKARHGLDWYKKNMLTYVTNKPLEYAHSLFCADGSGTIQYRYKRSDGKWSTMKLFVMFVSDVASRAIVGWSVAPVGQHKESGDMVKEAVKMAVQTGGYQTMFEFISDNHSAFTSGESKDFLNLVFNKVRTIEAGNSQANPSELQFKLFKSSLKDQRNFLSSSWQTSIEGQANTDGMNDKDLPTYEDAIIQMHELVKRWNATPLNDGVSPRERFAIKNEKCRPLQPTIVRQLFGNHTEVNLSNTRGYVNVSKSRGYNDSDKYMFEIPEYGGLGTEILAKATSYVQGVKVKVVWDEQMADLYTLDGKFIMSCPPALKGSQSHAEMTEEQSHAVGHNVDRKKKQLAYAEKFENQIVEIVQEHYSDLPYSQAMAMGGNKETYNAERLQNENTNLNNKTKERIDRMYKKNNDGTNWSEI